MLHFEARCCATHFSNINSLSIGPVSIEQEFEGPYEKLQRRI